MQVVIGLEAPPVARAHAESRVLTPSARRARLNLGTAMSRGHIADLTAAQERVARGIRAAIPSARLRWRYRVVLNAIAVVVPASQLERLARVPGVERVYPNTRYRARLDRSPALIGAPALWGPSLESAGAGMKIAIIDDGIDQTHPFFDPRGYPMPAGFPKGDTRFTTAKVIVARAFPPPSPEWRHAGRPFDPEESEHATHVAGIAAGNPGTLAPGGVRVSGVAPRAYLGNYKALTIPTISNVGLDGNAPELAAAVEAAVRDGMDVLNL